MLQYSRARLYFILTIIVGALILLVPNFLPKETLAKWPGFLPKQQINLGLDLKGGSYLLYEVDIAALMREKFGNVLEDIRTNLREKRIPYASLRQTDTDVRVTITDAARHDEALKLIRGLVQPAGAALFGAGAGTAMEVGLQGNDVVVSMPDATRAETARNAIAQSIEVIRRRLDAMGTAEPMIAQQGNNRIIIQLPGVKLISQLLLFVPLIAIFYFLIIRPQNKRMREHREMIAAVRRGDTVVTGGGIVGKVVKVEDGEVQVEIADGVRIRVIKGTITEVRAKGEPAPAAKAVADDKSAQ